MFTGDRCPVPIIDNATHFYVGVYAGDLHTTTPAYVSARKSILCGGTLPPAPAPDVYMQIMELLNAGMTDEQLAFALDELGWWNGKVYRSKRDGNTFNPDVTPEWWELVSE